MRRTKWSSLAVFLAVPVLAQTDATYLLTSSNTVTPKTPTTTIGVWATWVDPTGNSQFIFADYDLTAGEGVFSNPVNVLNGGGSSTGVIAGNVISGASNGQSFFPWPHWFRPFFNPILLATYDWTTTNFTTRRVSLDTSNTTGFVLALLPWGFPVNMLENFTAGSGVINVVSCYADCDQSTGVGVLDIIDFLCFQNSFVSGTAYACDCDTSTGPLVCDIIDFLCFQNAFVAGCP